MVFMSLTFGLLFGGRVTDNWVKRHFKPALCRGELRSIRFHDLRHTYATLLINAGENIKFIQSQMGHSSIQTTMDRYGHLYPEINLGVGARLDQMVSKGKVADEKMGSQSL
ncbi:MAG: tyrosine-type recombinase/integrase [Nitrospina sp.]|jgi:integrase|nr:tyrosine-type recombinase/integrase [Nitrospina sp.]